MLSKLDKIFRHFLWEQAVKKYAHSLPCDIGKAIRVNYYEDFKFKTNNVATGFESLIGMVNFAIHAKCNNILEIGGGASTAIWAKYASQTGAKITTVEAEKENLFSRLPEPALFDVRRNVKFVEATSISRTEFENFYFDPGHRTYAGIPVDDIMRRIDPFIDTLRAVRETRRVAQVAGARNWSVKKLLMQNDSLCFSKPLLELYSRNGSLDFEMEWLTKSAAHGRSNALDSMITEEAPYDFIFLDSGEMSSMIEWLKVKDHVCIGGLAAFHDIFFPKSFKNFLVCASVIADPKWKPLLLEVNSRQGLMIAERIQK